MAAQATPSNNALGRSSLPSSFFAPLQTYGGESVRRPDPDPDPDVVRGAISRLALRAALRQGAERSSPSQADSGEAMGSTSVAESLSPSPVTSEIAFAEVARRVWSEGVDKTASATGVAPADLEYAAMETVVPAAANQSPVGYDDTVSTSAPAQAFSNRYGTTAEVQPGSEPVPHYQPQLGTRQGPAIGEATTVDAFFGSEEAHALAHDANNLLSALRLYSELLCFSGVLHERHRHYAEDLKLLSHRSERLIERLLKLAQHVSAAERAEGRVAGPAQFGAAAAASIGVTAAVAVPGPEGVQTSAITCTSLDPVTGRPVCASDAPEPASLADVLMRMRGLLGTIAHRALVIDLGAGAATRIPVPEEALERILVNLVTNAAAAIGLGGAIRIRAGFMGEIYRPTGQSGNQSAEGDVSSPNPTVVLTIDDSGSGMNDVQLRAARGEPLLNDRRVDDAASSDGVQHAGPMTGRPARTPDRTPVHWPVRTETARHGRGLSIVRELVQAYGGRLFIQSREGTGTRMEIHWEAAGPFTQRSAEFPGRGVVKGLSSVSARQPQAIGDSRETAKLPQRRGEFVLGSRFGPALQGALPAQSTLEVKGAVA